MSRREIFKIEAGLYISNHTEKNSVFIDMAADFFGMFVMVMTDCLCPWYWVSNKIRESTAHVYVKKQLFLGQYQK